MATYPYFQFTKWDADLSELRAWQTHFTALGIPHGVAARVKTGDGWTRREYSLWRAGEEVVGSKNETDRTLANYQPFEGELLEQWGGFGMYLTGGRR